MKGLIVLIVLVGVALWAVIQFGGFASMDPAAQAMEFKQKVQPGMGWEEVCDLREPKKYHSYYDTGGETQPIEFKRDDLRNDLANGGHRGGFNFKYVFSGDEQYQVNFGSDGKVESVEKMRTFNDFATGKTWQN